jgi:hypothetical protein
VLQRRARVSRLLILVFCERMGAMLGWLRQLLPKRVTPPAKPAVVLLSRWPDEVQQLFHWAEVEASLHRARAIVFISVDWSCQERHSRGTFAEFVLRMVREHSELAVWCAVVSEHSEGVPRWFEALALPGAAATGYGAVVWMQRGKAVDLVPYAAQVGAEELVNRTLHLWGSAEQPTPADRPRD